jgi:DNA-binding transcriptional MocR family regulator
MCAYFCSRVRASRFSKVCVTTGSQEALARAFEMLLNEGDTLLSESPT